MRTLWTIHIVIRDYSYPDSHLHNIYDITRKLRWLEDISSYAEWRARILDAWLKKANTVTLEVLFDFTRFTFRFELCYIFENVTLNIWKPQKLGRNHLTVFPVNGGSFIQELSDLNDRVWCWNHNQGQSKQKDFFVKGYDMWLIIVFTITSPITWRESFNSSIPSDEYVCQ